MSRSLLEIDDLSVTFGDAAAVRSVSLSVSEGEAVGLVGESGSGKSITMLAALGLLPPHAQSHARRLRLGDHDVAALSERALRRLRGGTAGIVFQDPLTALNPLLPVASQVAEVARRHKRLSRRAAWARAIALLEQVGIRDAAARARAYPHEFSGGMRQRVMIACALAADPALLIADEPTTALDVTVQAEIVRLIRTLQRERGMGLVWVTHDLALMAGIVDRVVVMYAGRVMETAPVDRLYAAPRHPYTQALLGSLSRLDQKRGERGRALPGQPPDPRSQPTGCVFAARCSSRFDRCAETPPMFVSGASAVACWKAEA